MNEKQYFRERILMPIATPLAAATVVGVVTFFMSRMLLAVNEKTAPMVGLLVALNILFACSLIASGRVKPQFTIAVAGVAAAVLIGGGALGLAVGERPIGHEGEGAAEKPAAGTEHKPATAAALGVDVADNDFKPQEITVEVGEKVLWTQTGISPHSVTADDGSFDSHGDCSGPNQSACMQEGDTFETAFDKPGTYGYYCKIHGGPGTGMAGTVVVK